MPKSDVWTCDFFSILGRSLIIRAGVELTVWHVVWWKCEVGWLNWSNIISSLPPWTPVVNCYVYDTSDLGVIGCELTPVFDISAHRVSNSLSRQSLFMSSTFKAVMHVTRVITSLITSTCKCRQVLKRDKYFPIIVFQKLLSWHFYIRIW